MKILEIHIYGYGKLENIKFQDLNDFQVFYGKNETGKTTIMSFIHSVLFGFPTKQQSELRYEPKKGAKYGGQLIVEFKEKGRVVIERVKGKATGDVSVLLSDGTIGGEELLRELLSRMDKTLYQSIFSFNLQGLQNVHHLKSEDLGRFLFSTGTIGSERLLTTENSLQKELDARFKPNGKKPYINEKIKEVKEIYHELKKAEQLNAQYSSLLLQKDLILKENTEREKARSSLQIKLHQLQEWKKLVPVVNEIELLEGDLEKLKWRDFPIDGRNRLEQLNHSLKPIEAQISALQQKEEHLTKELHSITPNLAIIEKETEIDAALENLSLYEALKEEEGEWRSKLAKVKVEIQSLKERLHVHISDDSLAKSNTSIFMKEKTAEARRKQIRLQERKLELEESFKEEKDLLKKIEEQIKQLEKSSLSVEEREEKQQRVSKALNKEIIEKELDGIRDKLRLLHATALKEKEQAKQSQIQRIFIALFFLLLTTWGVWNSEWLLTLLGGGGLLIVLYSLITKKSTKSGLNINKETHLLKEKEKALLEQLNDASPREMELLTEQLRRDSEIQNQLSALRVRLEQQKDQYNKIIHALESWEEEKGEHEKLLLGLGNELSLPEEVSLSYIHEAFLLLEELKEYTREYEYIQEQIEKKAENLKRIHHELRQLKELFPNEETLSLREAIFLLKRRVKEETANQIKYEEKAEKLLDVKEQFEKLINEQQQLYTEKENLFQLAQVNNEEEYRFAGKEDEKRLEVLKRIEELTKQVQLSAFDEEEISQFRKINDLQVEIDAILSAIATNDEEIKSSQEELADIKHRISLLEEGGGYAHLLHTFKQLKSELEIEAKDWARYALAKDYLKKTIDRFRNEHLPNMLRQAEEYLSFLTEGNYTRIIPKDDSSGFLIERKDRLLFEANELSQATTEQVYVSLRLALATTIYKKSQFPIIIDDSFVNFDHIRTEKVIQLVRKMKNNQILFFTCHQHLLSYFDENQVSMMEEKESISLYH